MSYGILGKTISYTFAVALNRGTWILLTPLLAVALTVEEFGKLDIWLVGLSLFSTSITFGLDSSMVRNVFTTDSDALKFSMYTMTLLEIVMLGTIMIAGISVLAGRIAIYNINVILDYYLIILCISSAVAFSVYNINLQMMRCCQDDRKYFFYSVGIVAIQIPLIVFFHNKLKNYGASLIALIVLVTYTGFAVLSLYSNRKYLNIKPCIQQFKDIQKYAAKYFCYSLSQSLSVIVDRFYLIGSLSITMIGTYSISARLATIINIISLGFILAWTPIALRMQAKENARVVYSKVFSVYVLCCTILLVTVFCLSMIMYVNGIKADPLVVYILCLSYIAIGAYSLISIGLTIENSPFKIAWPAIVGLIVSVCTYGTLIENFDGLGAAFGVLIGNAVAISLLYRTSAKIYKVNYDLKLIIECLSATIFVVVLGKMFYYNLNPIWIVSVYLIVCLFVLLYFIKNKLFDVFDEVSGSIKTI